MTQTWKYKKGKHIHLDDIYDIQAFVMDFLKPIKPDYIIDDCWDADTSDTYKVIKSFQVKVIITNNNK